MRKICIFLAPHLSTVWANQAFWAKCRFYPVFVCLSVCLRCFCFDPTQPDRHGSRNLIFLLRQSQFQSRLYSNRILTSTAFLRLPHNNLKKSKLNHWRRLSSFVEISLTLVFGRQLSRDYEIVRMTSLRYCGIEMVLRLQDSKLPGMRLRLGWEGFEIET